MLAESGAMEGMSQFRLMRSRRLWPLTLAQSCGAFNDNLVKNAMIVLAIFKLGIGGAGLSALAGALFIAPYILLSASAGMLADRFAKPRLVVIYKMAEIALMVAAALAFLFASVPALLFVLVGLGIQAALFGPVKYGVLPEYLGEAELLAGNGVIEATTFLSIVCGTVAGGGLILLDTGPAVVGAVGVILALVGLAAAARMPPLRPADPDLRLTPDIITETWKVIRTAHAVRPIWLSILGLSWFWTIGATLLTEFPVVARDTMGAEGSVLTVFLAVFAVGVGLGSISTARLLRGRASARLAPSAACGISLFCWDFSAATSAAGGIATAGAMIGTLQGWRMLADLMLLAGCGGVFSVPLYAVIQEASVPSRRSRMIAANNIMNAVFMVGGSGAAAGLAKAGLNAPEVLRVAAGANLLAALWIARRRDVITLHRRLP
jgi:acyl-[acyl-carrier-protein]-phospholipid O-acyltransferase/long-chain-fatty-acid--[acyl-carrier-protein] ligase